MMDGEQLFAVGRRKWRAEGVDSSRMAGKMLVRFPQDEPLATYRLGLEIAERRNDAFEIAFCQRLVGQYLSHTEFIQDEGVPLMEASLKNFQALGDKYYAAQVLDELGWSYQLLLDLQAQERVVKQSLALRREIGDKIGTGNSLRNMGWSGGFYDNTDTAYQSWGEAKAIAYEMNDRLNIGWNASLQGANLIIKGEFDRAEVLLNEGYPYASELGDPIVTGFILIMGATIAGLRDEDYVNARQLLEQGYPPGSPPDFRVHPVALPATVVACGLADFEVLQPYIAPMMTMLPFHGAEFTLTCFPALVLKLTNEGQYERAAELLPAFLEAGLSYGGLKAPMEWAYRWGFLNRLRETLRARLGEAAFEAAQERSKAIRVEELFEKMRHFLDQLADE
jgi:hypothetical protein